MIHERGFWMDKRETDTHEFDRSLCDSIIREFQRSNTFIDLGCGDGSYTKALIEAGFICEGYDGSPLTINITDGLCNIADLSIPTIFGQFSVVLCLEVGEHIPIEYESVFIDNVCNASKYWVVLSWAVEGQPGIGHVNCRNNDYVISEMKKRGFKYINDMTGIFRRDSTLPWFKNTLMVFSKW